MNRAQRRYMEREGAKIQQKIIKEEFKKMKQNPEKYRQDAVEFFENYKIQMEQSIPQTPDDLLNQQLKEWNGGPIEIKE